MDSTVLPPPTSSDEPAVPSQPSPPPTARPSQPPPPRPATARRERTAGHVVAIVIGCLLLLPGAGMLAGGGALAVGQAVATDEDGYFRFTLDRIETDGVAVAATEVWFDGDAGEAPWLFDWLDVDLRFRVEGAAPTDEVFVGIGRAADVARYLDGAERAEVVELDGDRPVLETVPGARSIDAPVDAEVWTQSVVGDGEQELTWEARGGRWAVVVMNADGSPGVAADVQLAARSGAVTPVAATLLITGTVLTIGAVVLIVVGARGRRVDPGRAAAPASVYPGQPIA